jgi:chemotaxis protein methyltransferase CheR
VVVSLETPDAIELEYALEAAKAGIVPLEGMQQYTESYIRSGGARDFSECYAAAYDAARFNAGLLGNVVFALHNLATDRAFSVICRNVLIYVDIQLQNRFQPFAAGERVFRKAA